MYLQIGKVLKLAGYRGHVALTFEPIYAATVSEQEFLFIKCSGKPVPFYVKELIMKGEGLAVAQFEDIHNEEQAREILQKPVLLSAEAISDPSNKYAALAGFEARDTNGRPLGYLSKVTTYPMQLMGTLTQSGKEHLVPLNEQTVNRIDKKYKIVYLALPEGLTDINEQIKF